VTLVGGNEAANVDVIVHIEKETTREFKVDYDRIHTTAVPEGLDIATDEEEDHLTIELQGLKSALDQVDENTIVGIVDVDKYMKAEKIEELNTGNYIMPVTFTIPDGTKVSREYKVRVKVRKAD